MGRLEFLLTFLGSYTKEIWHAQTSGLKKLTDGSFYQGWYLIRGYLDKCTMSGKYMWESDNYNRDSIQSILIYSIGYVPSNWFHLIQWDQSITKALLCPCTYVPLRSHFLLSIYLTLCIMVPYPFLSCPPYLEGSHDTKKFVILSSKPSVPWNKSRTSFLHILLLKY